MTDTGEMIRGYRDLRVWQLGMDLTQQAYAIARSLPFEERFALSQQIRRCAVSIPANIAEGHGRRHLGDYLRALSIASGSLKELETEILLAVRLGMIKREAARPVLAAADSLGRHLTVLRKRLEKCRSVT